MGDESSTAQVHPEKLTKAFMEEAGKAGAKVHQGTVTGIKLSLDSPPKVQGQPPELLLAPHHSPCKHRSNSNVTFTGAAVRQFPSGAGSYVCHQVVHLDVVLASPKMQAWR